MCKYHFFHSLDELNRFANENGLELNDREVSEVYRDYPESWYSGLISEGMTELCYVYRLSEYVNGTCHVSKFIGIAVVGTDKVLTLQNPKGSGKPGSWDFQLFGTQPLYLMGDWIKPTREKPNGIGRMNRKALDRWIEYLEACEAELKAISEEVREKNRIFLERVLRRFPNAEVKYYDGLAQKIFVRFGLMEITWEGLHSGNFHRTIQLNREALPSDDDILDV